MTHQTSGQLQANSLNVIRHMAKSSNKKKWTRKTRQKIPKTSNNY